VSAEFAIFEEPNPGGQGGRDAGEHVKGRFGDVRPGDALFVFQSVC
jgi:hypothetical protein